MSLQQWLTVYALACMLAFFALCGKCQARKGVSGRCGPHEAAHITHWSSNKTSYGTIPPFRQPHDMERATRHTSLVIGIAAAAHRLPDNACQQHTKPRNTTTKRPPGVCTRGTHAQQEDTETGAPAAATYKSQSGGIVDVLEDLKDRLVTDMG